MPNRKKAPAQRRDRDMRVPMTGAELRRAHQIATKAGEPLATLARRWFFERAEIEKLG